MRYEEIRNGGIRKHVPSRSSNIRNRVGWLLYLEIIRNQPLKATSVHQYLASPRSYCDMKNPMMEIRNLPYK